MKQLSVFMMNWLLSRIDSNMLALAFDVTDVMYQSRTLMKNRSFASTRQYQCDLSENISVDGSWTFGLTSS